MAVFTLQPLRLKPFLRRKHQIKFTVLTPLQLL